MIDLLFIYGTLLQDQSNEFAQYLRSRSEVVGDACFQGELYEISWYPGVIAADSKDDQVYGQLVRLTGDIEQTMIKLDEYEGYYDNNLDASEFIRKRVSVIQEEETISCWIYLFNQPTRGMFKIESGDYRAYASNKN